MIRRLIVLGLVVALGVLTGCSSSTSGNDKSTSPSASPSPKTSATTKASPAPSQHSLPPASKIKNTPSVRKYVTLSACTANADGWQASGTAADTKSDSVSYKIVVFFTDAMATTLNYATVTVPVPAGTTVKWVAKAKLEKIKVVKCVLRAVSTV